MKQTLCISSACLLLALPAAVQAQTPPLRLEPRTNSCDLVLGSMSSTGALFLFQAPDLQTLADAPSLLLQTDTPLASELRVRVQPGGSYSNQAFFSAAHWPGLSTDDFGDPENYPEEPPPDMVLVTAGVPDPLVAGQPFTVDFFVIDPAGHLLDVTQAVSIRVLRDSDWATHPDAQVTPAAGQMEGGHLRLTLTITAGTSLEGFTLGLGPAGMRLLNLTAFLKTAFNISTNISITTSNELYQALEARRTANADPNPVWAYPLSGAGYPVAGTFGEWRGDSNTSVHKGLDLAAPFNSRVYPSRSGIVSFIGLVSQNKPCLGHCVVIDHGGGWFSLYLHLAKNTIGVKVGQAVVRGQTTLATNLLTGGCIGTHLHFEIQRTNNASQWTVRNPGSSQDPLQIAAINPGSGLFPVPFVPLGTRPPELEEFGLTGKSPGQYPFVKPTTTIPDPTGSVFVYARFLDREQKETPNSDCDGRFYRLGLRAIGFQPENVTTNNWIWPSNQVAIAGYLPAASSGKTKGFAKYKIPPNSNRCAYYRYWWQWDTSSYAAERKGPRPFVLTGEGYSGGPSAIKSYDFTFGPQVKDNTLISPVSGQYLLTLVAHLGTNTPAALGNAALFVQPDKYKLEIIKADGQPLGDVTWTPPPLADGYTRAFTTHLEEAVYSFTLRSGTTPDGLKLRVSSRLAPDIGHEVKLGCDCSISSYLVPVLVDIPAGTFTMGSPWSEPMADSGEVLHTVTISRAFKMGKYEVTQAEYQSVMGYNPSQFTGDSSRPVEHVSWQDANDYCCRLTACEARALLFPVGWAYRLPTEAEWEYACRAGTTTAFHYGAALHSGMANFDGRYEYPPCGPTPFYCRNANGVHLDRTTSVGSYLPNAWGLCDMHGNVDEWCQDWYGPYSGGNVTDPQGPPSGSSRVVRGGLWGCFAYAGYCRSAMRNSGGPTTRSYTIGFRVVLAPGQ